MNEEVLTDIIELSVHFATMFSEEVLEPIAEFMSKILSLGKDLRVVTDVYFSMTRMHLQALSEVGLFEDFFRNLRFIVKLDILLGWIGVDPNTLHIHFFDLIISPKFIVSLLFDRCLP